MKKLLFVITQADFGGAQRAVFELATGLKDRYQITVAAGEPAGSDELLQRCLAVGIRTIRLRHLRRAISPIHDLLAVFELRQLIKKENFDLVHAHSSKAGIIASLAHYSLLTTHYSLIYTAHGWVFQEPQNPLRRLIYLWMEKIAARSRDATIVLSENEKKIALEDGCGTKATIRVIPNGVVCPPSVGRTNDGLVIGTIANLYATKGLDTLVAAADLVRGEEPRARFVIVGHGPEEKRIRDEINRRNLDEIVRLAGYVPNAKDMLSTFDLFVLSSRKEGLPFAILDAAAAGVPIVATAVGGIPEALRDGVDSLLVPKDDPDALAKAILTLLRDHDLARRLASSAKERVCKEYTIERMIRETARIYNQAR